MSTTLGQWFRSGALGAALLFAGSASAQTPEKPQYGGTLEVATIFATLSALSWDHKDWPWKINHDAGGIYESLLTADLTKGTRAGGKHAFNADAWIPSDAIKGELAESWEVQKDPAAVIFKLKKGIMFPAKPGVMEAREFTADDVVFSYYYRRNSPRRPPGIAEEIDQGRSARPLHGRVSHEPAHGRLAVLARLRLQRLDHAQGSRRRRRSRLEEPQRHRTVHAHGIRSRKLPHLQQAPGLLGQGKDRRGRVQAAVRRQGRLSRHQGHLHPHHGVPHRQARHRGSCRLGEHRFAEAIRSRDQVQAMDQFLRHHDGAAHRPEAVRRHPRAPRPQHGRQQGRDHQVASSTAMPSCSPIRCIRPTRATTSRSAPCPTR